MKKNLLILLSILSFAMHSQTTYTYSGIGDWDEEVNWSPSYPGTTINEEDEIIITENAEVTALFITINGSLTIKGSLFTRSFLTLNGPVVNDGSLVTSSTLRINNTFTNNGTLRTQSTTIINDVIENNNQWFSQSTLNNYGTINNEDTCSFSSTFNNFGYLNNNGVVTTGTLQGTNLSHTNDFELTQTLKPNTESSQIGTYRFDKNLSFSSSATITISIKNDSTDKIVIADTAYLDSKITFDFVDDFIPTLGYKQTIITAGKVEGCFENISFPELGDYEIFLTYTENTVEMEVINRHLSFTYTGIGDWTEQKKWTPRYPGTVIAEDEEVIIADTADVTRSSSITINGSLINNGIMTSRSILNINGSMINNGTMISNSFFDINGSMTNNGIMTSNSIFDINGSVINKGTLSTNSTAKVYGSFHNMGLAVSRSTFLNFGTMNNDSIMTITTFYNYGELNNNADLTISSKLYGNNLSHTNNVTLNNDLIPSTANSDIGTYRFDSNFTMGNNADMIITVLDDFTDLVIVKDTAYLNGTIEVELTEGSDPAIGSADTILKAAFIVNTFDQIELPELDDSKEFFVSYTDKEIILSVIASDPNGVNDKERLNKLSLYPNPTNGIITTEVGQVEIFDSVGNLVFSNYSNGTIDVSYLSSGVYIFTLEGRKTKLIIE